MAFVILIFFFLPVKRRIFFTFIMEIVVYSTEIQMKRDFFNSWCVPFFSLSWMSLNGLLWKSYKRLFKRNYLIWIEKSSLGLKSDINFPKVLYKVLIHRHIFFFNLWLSNNVSVRFRNDTLVRCVLLHL